jgi:hypothetical protein
MQNGFVGDIGDFGKYVLLRELFGKPEVPETINQDLRLGVIWYYNQTGQVGNWTPNIYQNLQPFDVHLYNCLHYLVHGQGPRTVAAVEASGILPVLHLQPQRCFFIDPIMNLTLQVRQNVWTPAAINTMDRANVVFMDPDKGIHITLNNHLQLTEVTNSAEHLSLSELLDFYNNCESLIIYHHLGQGLRGGERAPDRIRAILRLLYQGLNPVNHIWALRWRRRQGRVFFVVVHPNHAAILNPLVQAFVNNPLWFQQRLGFRSAHFENVELNQQGH